MRTKQLMTCGCGKNLGMNVPLGAKRFDDNDAPELNGYYFDCSCGSSKFVPDVWLEKKKGDPMGTKKIHTVEIFRADAEDALAEIRRMVRLYTELGHPEDAQPLAALAERIQSAITDHPTLEDLKHRARMETISTFSAETYDEVLARLKKQYGFE